MQLFEVGHGIEHVDYHRSRMDTGPYTIWIGFAPQQCQVLAGPSKTDNVLRRRHFRHRHIWRFRNIFPSIPKRMRDHYGKDLEWWGTGSKPADVDGRRLPET